MAKQDGKTSPFDGSGGNGGGGSVDQAMRSRPQQMGSDPVTNVPAGGPLPFIPPRDPPGGANKLGAGTLGSQLPVRFTGK